MSFAIGELKRLIKVPFGVNYLWDPVATVALAVASGARFAREIFTGVYDSDMGLWAPDAAGALRLRTDGHRQDLEADVQHQCRVRRADRRPLASPSAPRARCSPRSPTSSWSPGR